jgi:16S rRNA (cytidine1402-2'-O)-methyltransferase
VSIEPGVLYVVATPIGNLGDVTRRALETLAAVALIAAEDTRHTGRLLRHYGVGTPTTALHEHNERAAVPRILARLRAGEAVALVSDAGTPLLSDPGAHLVAAARAEGLPVVPVPGPSAAVAALSVAGFAADRFVFEGFLPARAGARRARLQALVGEDRTLVFYEAPHRIRETLEDLVAVFGAAREALLARELTKAFEESRRGPLADLAVWVATRPERERGEYVVVVAGCEPAAARAVGPEEERVLRVLLEALAPSAAAPLAARLTGAPRRALYARALAMVGKAPGHGAGEES